MFDRVLNTPLLAATKRCSKVKNWNLRNTFFELLLFIDSLFTETATPFRITDINNNNIFVCRSSYFIKCFKKTVFKVSVNPKSSLLEIFFPDHKFLKGLSQANLSVNNHLRRTSQKRAEYVSMTFWRRVNKNSLIRWYVLKTSWRCLEDIFARRLEDILKTFWRRLEDVLKTS